MPRRSTETKRRIIDAAYELFYKDGFARGSIDEIAEAAGVTKRTLYYHFDSKQALLAAVLEVQHELALSQSERWMKHISGDPVAMVEKLFTEAAVWARQPKWRGSGFTRAAMEFAHLPGHPARLAARRHKAVVEGRLAERFAAKGIRASQLLARQIQLLIEGCHSLILIHGDTTYADAAREAARLLVERHLSPRSTRRP